MPLYRIYINLLYINVLLWRAARTRRGISSLRKETRIKSVVILCVNTVPIYIKGFLPICSISKVVVVCFHNVYCSWERRTGACGPVARRGINKCVCVEVCGGGKGQVIRDRCGRFGGGGSWPASELPQHPQVPSSTLKDNANEQDVLEHGQRF